MDFQDYLVPGKTGLLIGIGGVSMSPLAEVLHDAGLDIRGSDMSESDNTLTLRERGIPIHIGHSAANVTDDIEFVIRTAAVHDDNPEVHEAHRRGIPVFERTQAWGALMRGYPNALCISGTHGKTTTTSMCTHIMMAAEKDPTVMIGGTLPLLHACHRVGKGNTIIMESCEYYNSFLALNPTIDVILNIEADHLDFFKDIEDIKHSFRQFAERVPAETGTVIANCDDVNTMDALRGIERKVITFGLSPKADVYAENIIHRGSSSEFDIYHRGNLFAHVTLHVPGIHNVRNALAATAAAIVLGVSPNAVKYGLAGFEGGGLIIRASSRARICMTIMRTTRVSCAHCSTRWIRSIISARSSCSSRTPTAARQSSSMILWSSCAARRSSIWRRSMLRARKTPSAFLLPIWPRRSRARSFTRRLRRLRPSCAALPARATLS